MNAKEQIEADLRSFASSGIPSSLKKLIDQIIYNLRSSGTNFIIFESSDPFVSLFEQITLDKKLENQTNHFLSIICTLISNKALDGSACESIFSSITNLMQNASENFLMKILQISLTTFSCSFSGVFSNFEPHQESLNWVFTLSHSSSPLVAQVAQATAFQISDILFDQITCQTGHHHSKSQNDLILSNEDIIVNGASDAETIQSYNHPEKPTIQVINETHWTVSFAFNLISNLLKRPSIFSNTFEFLRHIFDEQLLALSLYSEKFQILGKNLIYFIQSQTSIPNFTSFIPHAILYLRSSFSPEIKQILYRIISYIKDQTFINSRIISSVSISMKNALDICSILSTISAIITISPSIIPLFQLNDLILISQISSTFIVSHMQQHLSRPIRFNGFSKFSLSNFNSQPSISDCVVSCIELIFSLIGSIPENQNFQLFKSISHDFEAVWDHAIQIADDTSSLGSSLKLSRIFIRTSISLQIWDSAQRILAVLCALTTPSSNNSLNAKAVVSLHTILRLIKQLGKDLEKFWPQIFEAISKCHHCAALCSSSSDAHALRLIDTRPMEWTKNLPEKSLKNLFEIILALSEKDYRDFLLQQDTVPNFWSLQTLAIIFGLNLDLFKSDELKTTEDLFFNHLKKIMQCSSQLFRIQAANAFSRLQKM